MPRIEWCRSILLALLLLFPVPSRCADHEFREIVNQFSARFQKQPTLNNGLLNFLASRFAPSGVSRIKMAVFDELDPAKNPTGEEFETFLKTTIHPDLHAIVRIQSNRDGERILVFCRELKKHFEILVLTAGRTEAIVLKMRLNPTALGRWLEEPAIMAKHSGKRSADCPDDDVSEVKGEATADATPQAAQKGTSLKAE
jgi:hypothetical protein